MKKVILIALLSIISNSYGQKEANIWYFGYGAGLDFTTGDPVALTNGQLSTTEGCSSFADPNGDLLFYSDGITVYDRNHQVMQNGTNLGGNPSSSQSGLIVPKPGDPDIYYLFTVGTNAVGSGSGLPANAGFKYYTINMQGNLGLGRVDVGFVDLSGGQSNNWTEKVTAVKADGCNSVWVISLVNNKFYSYLINDTGVSTSPVISTVANTVADVRGYLKVSPDATKLVSANMSDGTYLYDFDSATGVVSNGHSLNVSGAFGYGVEFSLNSQVLYISTGNYLANSLERLYQFNLNLPNISAINGSRTIIHSYTNTRGALQLAPNEKIYWTSDNSNMISVINNPEVLGAGCNYSHLSVSLGGKPASQGLPPFIQSLFLPNVDIINDGSGTLVDELDLCDGDLYTLAPDTTTHPATTTYLWSLDNVDLALPDTTTSINIANGTAFGAGNYRVLIEFNDGVSCPFLGEAQINYHNNPNLTTPITIKQCDDDTDGFSNIDLTLVNENISVNFANEDFEFYHTQNGADTKDVTDIINAPENYYTNSTGENPLWVRVENEFCYSIGEVNIVISTTSTNFSKTIYLCDDYIDTISSDTDGFSVFNLAQFESDLLNEFPIAQRPDLVISYYHNIAEAQLQTNGIADPSNYRNVNNNTITTPERIYIRVNNNSNIDCAGLGSNLYIDLVVEELPVAHQINDMRACETLVGSIEAEFNTTVIPNLVLQGQTNVTLSYYEDDNGVLTEIPAATFISANYLSQTKEITIRLTNNTTNQVNTNDACYDEMVFNLIVDDLPVINTIVKQTLCDDFPDQNDGMSVFDTSNIESTLLGGLLPNNMEIHYYYANTDGTNGAEIVPSLPEFFNTATQNINVELVNSNNTSCIATTTIEFEIVNDNPEFTINDQLLCVNLLPDPLRVTIQNPLELDYIYVWEDEFGNSISTDVSDAVNTTQTALITKDGEYTVMATSASMCTTTKTFTVVASSIAKVEKVTIFDDSQSNNIVSVLVSGIGNYEFSMDNENFVDANKINGHIFNNVDQGLHIIHINDKSGCLSIDKEIVVIRFPRYISPNGDNVNDYFFIDGGNDFISAKTTIFDRYGKIVAVLNKSEKWNGTFRGQSATETEYWFLTQIIDRDNKTHQRKGHFSLKMQ